VRLAHACWLIATLATPTGAAVLRVDLHNLTRVGDGSALHPYPTVQAAVDVAAWSTATPAAPPAPRLRRPEGRRSGGLPP